MEFQLAVQVK